MTKSELIEKLADKLSHLSAKEVEKSIKEILELMAQDPCQKVSVLKFVVLVVFHCITVHLVLAETQKQVNRLN